MRHSGACGFRLHRGRVGGVVGGPDGGGGEARKPQSDEGRRDVAAEYDTVGHRGSRGLGHRSGLRMVGQGADGGPGAVGDHTGELVGLRGGEARIGETAVQLGAERGEEHRGQKGDAHGGAQLTESALDAGRLAGAVLRDIVEDDVDDLDSRETDTDAVQEQHQRDRPP